jgi:hypothetical protein
MIALMAANPAGDLTHVVAEAESHLAPIKTTLLVVPSTRKTISSYLFVLVAYSSIVLQSWKCQVTRHRYLPQSH